MLRDFGLPDAGDPADLGVDAGMDAGTDIGVDMGDMGRDFGAGCDGPPGLYLDEACSILAPGVRAYEPTYWLWSDGTGKERYVLIPEGSTIDTTNPDEWIYPLGTTFWKTFLVGEQRVETRIYRKDREGVGVARWVAETYAWDGAGTSASLVLDGREDTLGTDHDIPTPAQCVQCHNGGGALDQVLGFGTIQLDHERPGSLNLAAMNEEGLLAPPVVAGMGSVPGDATVSEALGYLHVNCGMCHGGTAPQAGMALRLDVGAARAADTPAYRTAVGETRPIPSGFIFEPDPEAGTPGAFFRVVGGAPLESTLFRRMSVRDGADMVQMPPVGTEITDPEGLAIVRSWIEGLPRRAEP
ncbi:MAG: hypothetical protein AAGH15_12475 [Myxococcota bacterium]